MPDPFSPKAAAAQGYGKAPAQQDREPARERAKKPKRHHPKIRGHGRSGQRPKGKADWSGLGDWSAAKSFLLFAMLRGYHWAASIRRSELIAVTAACIVALAGTYAYRTAMLGPGETAPSRPSQTAQIPDNSVRASGGNKAIYERLTPEGAETPAAPPVQLASGPEAAPPDGSTVAKTRPNVPAASKPDPQVANAPTVLRSERYRSDGTRIDTPPPPAPAAGASQRTTVASADAPPPAPAAGASQRTTVASADAPPLAAVPSVVRLGPGQVRAPYLKSPQTSAQPAAETFVAAAAAEAPEHPASVLPAAVQTPAEPVPVAPAAGGYFVQVKSDQDPKAAAAEAAEVAEKYKAELREVPLLTRSADLKERGIWYRVLAGPVKSRDEAETLCKKLKDAGMPACIVQKFD